MIECFECKGTGSSVPDCDLCGGYRTVKAKRAYAKGWKKADLEVEDDGYCDCPACYDEARTCMFCAGDGTVSQLVKDQQRNRVLLTAKASRSGKITPCFDLGYRDGRLEVSDDIYLLSNVHARELRDQGLISWWTSVFGDEIYLTAEGEAAAKLAHREYRALCRQWLAHERERRLEKELISMIIDRPRIMEAQF